MTQLTVFPTTSVSGTGKTGPTTNNTNIQILLVNSSDSADPTTPVNGQIWWRNDGTTRYVLHAYINGSKVTMFGAKASGGFILEQALDCDGNELTNALCEKLATGALPAAGASTEGETPYDTTLDRFVFITANDQFYAAMCNLDGSTYIRIPCDITDTNIGTAGTANTGTIFGGFQLDAPGESLNVIPREPIPAGWTAAHDLLLDVDVLLLNAETANDTIDLDFSWRTLTPGSGDGPAVTPEAGAAVSLDITSGNAQYDIHRVTLTIDHDAVGNVVAVGDVLPSIITHDPAAGANPVAGVIVIGATLRVPVLDYHAA